MYQNLKAEMVRKGVSRHEIAKALGMHKNTLSRKLNGHSQFSYDHVCKIIELFFPEFEGKSTYLFAKSKPKSKPNRKRLYLVKAGINK